MNCKMVLFAAALVLLFVQSAFAQTEELSDTVWTKFTYPASINAVKFTPDGRFLASGGDDGIPKLWDAETGKLEREFLGNASKIWGMDINNTGNLLAVVNDSSIITIWDLHNGQITKIIDYYEGKNNSNGRCVAFSNQGEYLAAMLSHSGQTIIEHDLLMINANDWSLHSRISNIKVPFNVTFSPDDAVLAVSNYVLGETRTTVGIFQVPNLQMINAVDEFIGGNRQIAFSPDGKYLAGAISDGPNKVWNASDWKLFNEFGKDGYSVAFSPDSKYVILGEGGFKNWHIYIWDYEKKNKTYSYRFDYLWEDTEIPRSLDCSPDEKFIAAGCTDGIVMLNAKWNPTSVSENPVQITEPLIFPNPASETVNIRFNLVKPSQINIGIYDINSIKVADIYDGFLELGLQNFEWNISRITSGTYFARITALGATSTVKIIVEK